MVHSEWTVCVPVGCRSHSEWLDLWDVHTPFASGLQSVRDLVLRKYVPGAKTECIYHRSKLPGCIPCNIGKAQEPRTLSLFEHLNGTHWDGCTYGG